MKASQLAVPLKPNISFSDWTHALELRRILSDKTNPIGECLWFNTNKKYGERTQTVKDVCLAMIIRILLKSMLLEIIFVLDCQV